MGHERDEEMEHCTAHEEDFEGYEDEEDFVRHLDVSLEGFNVVKY